jgi:CelD/BcsL family acetyltransferase involved in cellulose biosynthesis
VGETVVLLALLLPSRRRDVGLWPTHGVLLHTSGDDAEDVITIEYNGFLVDRAWAGRAEPAALAYLTRGMTVAGRRLDEIHLRGVPNSYERLVPPALLRQVAARKPSWRVDLGQVRASGRPYLDGLSANTRQQIRRSVRLYEQRGKLAVRRAQSLPEGMLYLDGLRELHQRYWTAKGEPGGFGYAFFERFVRSLIERGLPSGAVELVQVSCADQPIGYLCNLVHDGHVYAYLSGLRYEGDPRLKPGLVSHSLCIERHVEEGARLYDFMAGEARYKAASANPGRRCCTCWSGGRYWR